MIEKICKYLTDKIRTSLPDVDDERAEIINYGLQNVIGEIPKIFLVLIISYLLGVFELTLLAFLLLLPYKSASGGFHLKTHIGCLIGTTTFYCGNAILSKFLIMGQAKYAVIVAVWVFSLVMIKLYAPADTENVPILTKKERDKKRILSYIFVTISLVAAGIIQDNAISNVIIIGCLVQSFSITRLAYKLTNNKYGYELYG